jgi:glycosyltransferase involved in cell wall biosynthesis
LKRVLTLKFDLRITPDGEIRQVLTSLPGLTATGYLPALWRALRLAQTTDLLFVSNPLLPELVFAWLAKLLYGPRLQVVVFDLIMRIPANARERLSARIKRVLLQAIDRYVFIHKDTSGYQQHFGVPADRCQYVPFKANNFDLATIVQSRDGDYILTLGASQRDYQTLVEAVAGLDVQLQILLPHASISVHNAKIDLASLPPNVQHLGEPVDRLQWSTLIANSRFVVVPLIAGVIQPAGISVYLEAMVLGKPVIITRGASTEGILNDNLAVVLEPGDSLAMRAAITRLWNDAGLRQTLSDNGKTYALGLGNHDRLVTDLRAIVCTALSSTS